MITWLRKRIAYINPALLGPSDVDYVKVATSSGGKTSKWNGINSYYIKIISRDLAI